MQGCAWSARPQRSTSTTELVDRDDIVAPGASEETRRLAFRGCRMPIIIIIMFVLGGVLGPL